MANVYGTNSSETLDWMDGVTNGADHIYGFGGDDIIWGNGGNDFIKGGGGADGINGGDGIDTLSYGDSATGVVVSLETGQGYGGTAEGDTFASIENLSGSVHHDTLYGNAGTNVLTGFGGDDSLKGGGGADTLNGDEGGDLLKGGGGADILNGGIGIDTADYSQSGSGVWVSLYWDTAFGGEAEGDQLNDVENITGSAHNDNLWGDGGANVLRGNDGNDYLAGLDGVDTLYGNDGDDTLIGGSGADQMHGGNGNDSFFVDNAGDVVNDTGAGTTETVYTSTSFALTAGADIEHFRTTDEAGLDGIALTGNNSSQHIRGNAGANAINGLGGSDVLWGGGGDDAFIFSSPLGPSNIDTISDYSLQDLIALDNAIFSNLLTAEGNHLSADEFTIGTAAADANDRIIYDSGTGALYYDADGSGAGAAVQFANVGAGLALNHQEFLIV